MTDHVGEYIEQQTELTYRHAYMRQEAARLALQYVDVLFEVEPEAMAAAHMQILDSLPINRADFEPYQEDLLAIARDKDRLRSFVQQKYRDQAIVNELRSQNLLSEPPELAITHYS